jgi:hypothetical protein
MVVLTATCKNGLIQLDQRLPEDLEGKQIQVMVQEVLPIVRKRRQAGSASGQIWMAPDFDALHYNVSIRSVIDCTIDR